MGNDNIDPTIPFPWVCECCGIVGVAEDGERCDPCEDCDRDRSCQRAAASRVEVVQYIAAVRQCPCAGCERPATVYESLSDVFFCEEHAKRNAQPYASGR